MPLFFDSGISARVVVFRECSIVYNSDDFIEDGIQDDSLRYLFMLVLVETRSSHCSVRYLLLVLVHVLIIVLDNKVARYLVRVGDCMVVSSMVEDLRIT